MGRFGGDSGALPWPCYAPLVWARVPWSRESVMRVDICRRPWREREVVRKETWCEMMKAKHTHSIMWLRTCPLFRWAVWPCATFKQRCGQHYLSDCVWKTVRLLWPQLPEDAEEPDRDGLSGRIHMGSSKTKLQLRQTTSYADQKWWIFLQKTLWPPSSFPLLTALRFLPSADETLARASQLHL